MKINSDEKMKQQRGKLISLDDLDSLNLLIDDLQVIICLDLLVFEDFPENYPEMAGVDKRSAENFLLQAKIKRINMLTELQKKINM